MKTRIFIILLTMTGICLSQSPAVSGAQREDLNALLVRKIPLRMPWMLTGSDFAKHIFQLDKDPREKAILRQLAAGNIPDFLRKLKPVHFCRPSPEGKKTKLTVFAMPDYLAIGSNHDFLLIPMALDTALEVAAVYGFTLPTRKIVDAIFKQSAFHLVPKPLPSGPQMSSTAYYVAHNQKIGTQRLAVSSPLGELIAGHKKDVVVSNRLSRRQGKIAIYGWHYPSGNPIQPLSTIHDARYADYSHGIRLISDTALLDGHPRSIAEILENPALAHSLSDEGPIGRMRDLLARHRSPPAWVEIPSIGATLLPP